MALKQVDAYNTYRRKRNDKGRLMYHQNWVWERVHHQKIPKNHVIHHIDGNCRNNHPRNLVLMSASDHTLLHNQTKYYLKWRKKKK